MIIGKSLTALGGGGLKPEIRVTAKTGALLNLHFKDSSIILQSYQLGAEETQHTFVVSVSDTAYVVEDSTNNLSIEVLVDMTALFYVKLKLTHENYVLNGILLNLNGVQNTRSGHEDFPSTWQDLSGNGYDASLVNSPVWLGNGLRFNGVNNYANLNYSGLYSSSIKTIEVCCKINSFSNNYGTVLFKGNGIIAANNHIQYSREGTSNSMLWILGNNNEACGIGLGNYFTSYSSMHTTSIVANGSVIKVYINGELKNTENNTVLPATNSTQFTLGRGSGDYRYCDCDVYAVRAYNRELTDNEILNNYLVDKEYLSV